LEPVHRYQGHQKRDAPAPRASLRELAQSVTRPGLGFLVLRHPGVFLFPLSPFPRRHRGRVLPEADLIGSCKCLSSPVTGLNIDPRFTDISIINPAKALFE